ncbi:MAG TPA: hypothetical protein VKQ36_00455 [Ktedonobacterales bacterium]|nr:hypothetical protein [Ktedonobacterales bacterium]
MTEHDALAECAALLEIDDPHWPVLYTIVHQADKRRIHTTGSQIAATSVARHLSEMTGQSYEVVARVRR